MKLKYAVVYERTANNYSAYPPDLPGCISTGKTWEEIEKNIREAITFHIEGLIAYGTPVPRPQMSMAEAMAFHRWIVDAQAGKILAENDDLVPQEESTAGMVEIEVESLNDLEMLHILYNPNSFVLGALLFKDQDLFQQQIDPSVPHNDNWAISEENQIRYTWSDSSYNVTTISDPNNIEVLPKIDPNAPDLHNQKWLSLSRPRQRRIDRNIYVIEVCA